MDDWDSVSDDTSQNGVSNSSDAVSTPQPSSGHRPVAPDNLVTSQQDTPFLRSNPINQSSSFPLPTRQPFISAPLLWKAALFVAIALVLAISGLGLFQAVLIHNGNVSATATAQEAGTVLATHAHATATAQIAATATTAQQIYAQATNGTPAFDDPLSDDSNNWGILNTDWGGTCAFTNGAYHIALSKAGYWLYCVPIDMTNLDNFALQVQMSIVQGNKGGVIFDVFQNNFYRVFISSTGHYVLTQYTTSGNKTQDLETGSSSAIKTGLNQPNIMTIIVNHSYFYLYVNSEFVTSARLNSYRQGNIGLSALSDNQPTEAVFSNFKIWTL
jgi:hypothetical protein